LNVREKKKGDGKFVRKRVACKDALEWDGGKKIKKIMR